MATSIIPSLLIEDFNVIPNKGEEGLTSIIYTEYILCVYCVYTLYIFEFNLSA